MGSKNLIFYIKEKQLMGYDLSTIRAALSKWGYNPKDIDEAIKSSANNVEVDDVSELPMLVSQINLKNSLKYFLYSLLIMFLLQNALLFLGGVGGMFLLANVFVFVLFVVVFFLFLLLFSGVYLALFRSLFKEEFNFKFFLSTFLFVSIPYILINSFSNLSYFGQVVLVDVSIGFFNFNLLFFFSFILFSWVVSKKYGLGFWKTLFYVLLPLMLLGVVVFFVFGDVLRTRVLGMVFENF